MKPCRRCACNVYHHPPAAARPARISQNPTPFSLHTPEFAPFNPLSLSQQNTVGIKLSLYIYTPQHQTFLHQISRFYATQFLEEVRIDAWSCDLVAEREKGCFKFG